MTERHGQAADDPSREVVHRPVLPRGYWGPLLPALEVDSDGHKRLVGCTENILRRLLATENYDSVSNFLAFYEAYLPIRQRQGLSLREMYRDFVPVSRPHTYTCVGLALELMRRWQCLEERFPGLTASTGVLSCEETTTNKANNIRTPEGPFELLAPDKEHVMVGVHFVLDGRHGMLVADPGYHVATVVTVMVDSEPPHTGWFNHQLDDAHRKDFNYKFSRVNPKYIIWREEENRVKKYNVTRSVIYAARPFCGGICLTEKRNLVYKIRSLVRRSHTGQLLAGIVFFLCPFFSETKLSVFFQTETVRIRQKHRFYFHMFLDKDNIPKETLDVINKCNYYLNYPEGKLLALILRITEVVSDESFILECLEMNAYIGQASK